MTEPTEKVVEKGVEGKEEEEKVKEEEDEAEEKEEEEEEKKGETAHVKQGNTRFCSRELAHTLERKINKRCDGTVDWRHTADNLVDLLASVHLSETPRYSLTDKLMQTKVY